MDDESTNMERNGRESTGGAYPSARDRAIDLVRCVALVRVVFWHLFAQTWMTWFAAIPLMFFVAGTLLPNPRHYLTFLHRRLRRILLPLWLYAATVAVASLWFAEPNATSPRGLARALTWVFPVVDPSATGWDSGWLSSHLWYIRAYLWILVLTPVLVRLATRVRWTVLAAVSGIAALEVAAHLHVPLVGHGSGRVLVGDALVYGCFGVLGIRYRRGGRLPSTRTLTATSAALFALAISYARVVGLPTGGVNNSYPAILVVGGAWLAALGALERPIRAVAERARVARATRALSSRSLTIYLWHPACIVLARDVVTTGGVLGAALMVPVTAGLLVVSVWLVGWVETVAVARRAAIARPATRSTAVGASAVAVTLLVAAGLPIIDGRTFSAAATGVQASGIEVGIPAPSARAALSDAAFGTVPTVTTVPPGIALRAAPVSTAEPDAPTTTTIADRRAEPDAAPEVLQWSGAFVSGAAASTVTLSVTPRSSSAARRAPTTAPRATSAALPTVTTATKASTATPVPAVTPTAAPSTTAPAARSAAPSTTTLAKGSSATPTTLPTTLPAAALQRALDTWRVAEQPTISSMVVAVRIGTQTWTAKSTASGAASNYVPDAPFLAASITKTFTAALVVREIENGTLKLDDPVPTLDGLDASVPAGITIRRLLTHTAGLVDYTAAPGYRADQTVSALQAVELSLHAPLQDGLGTTVRYANADYLYLGLLLQQVTGQPYSALVDGLARDAGLSNTHLGTETHPGWVGFSSGGIVSSAADLAQWGQALFTPGKILSAHGVSMLTTLGDMNLGLGTWPACPCSTDADGVKHYTAIGHHTADGGMFFFPATGTTIVAMFEPTGEDTHTRIVSLMGALQGALVAS